MGGELSVINNRIDDFEIVKANIFTPGQGICLQRLAPGNNERFKFDHSLAYFSWYDIQIIGRLNGGNELQRFLEKGIYLSFGKTINITELTHERNRDHAVEWACGSCRRANVGRVAICEHCHTNKSQAIITKLSFIPLVGLPFSLADAILRCGKASQSNQTGDQVEAGITVILCVIDVAAAPSAVYSLIKLPAEVATKHGIELSVKTFFSEAGKPLRDAIGKELVKDGIPAALKPIKVALREIINNG